jgi:steroid 5-alpha reductase family enzyme
VSGILVSLLVSLTVNALLFGVAAARKTDVVTDLSYCSSFVVVVLLLVPVGAATSVQLGAALLVVVWAIRLGTYLFRRILQMKVDHRFDGVREKPLRFARFWLFQALTVAIVMLPVSYLLSRPSAPPADSWTGVGAAVWLAGLLIESVADHQKSAFKADPTRQDHWVDSGLWRHSRHPNYFGEMLVWWGLFVYALPALHGAAYATAAGPVYITVLLIFVSGIPPLEKRAQQRYGADPAYQTYRRHSRLLVPLPRRSSE